MIMVTLHVIYVQSISHTHYDIDIILTSKNIIFKLWDIFTKARILHKFFLRTHNHEES